MVALMTYIINNGKYVVVDYDLDKPYINGNVRVLDLDNLKRYYINNIVSEGRETNFSIVDNQVLWSVNIETRPVSLPENVHPLSIGVGRGTLGVTLKSLASQGYTCKNSSLYSIRFNQQNNNLEIRYKKNNSYKIETLVSNSKINAITLNNDLTDEQTTLDPEKITLTHLTDNQFSVIFSKALLSYLLTVIEEIKIKDTVIESLSYFIDPREKNCIDSSIFCGKSSSIRVYENLEINKLKYISKLRDGNFSNAKKKDYNFFKSCGFDDYTSGEFVEQLNYYGSTGGFNRTYLMRGLNYYLWLNELVYLLNRGKTFNISTNSSLNVEVNGYMRKVSRG